MSMFVDWCCKDGLAMLPVNNGPAHHHGQESGSDGFSNDMNHSFFTDTYDESKSIEVQLASFVRPIETQNNGELSSFMSTGLADSCANLPVNVSKGPEDGQVNSGHLYKKGQVDDSASPGTIHRPSQQDGISTMMMNVNVCSGDPQSDIGVLAALPFDNSMMRKSTRSFKPENKPRKVAESVPSFPSEALDLAVFIKKGPTVYGSLSVPVTQMLPDKQLSKTSLEKIDGTPKCKQSERKCKPANSERDVVPLNMKLSMAKCQEDSKGPLSLPGTNLLPVDHGVIKQVSPQRKNITFYRKRRGWIKHLKLFLLLLSISAQIQDSVGICRECCDDGCAEAHIIIYGLNNALLYERNDSMTHLPYCSETSAPSQSKICNMCLDGKKVFIICHDCREAAGTLDVEGNDVRFKNIPEVDCPPLKAVASTTVHPTQPNTTQEPKRNSTPIWIIITVAIIVVICGCIWISFYCWKRL